MLTTFFQRFHLPNLKLSFGLCSILVGLGLLLNLLLFGNLLTASAAPIPGAVDPTFQSSAGTNSQVNAIALQPDGKILIGGAFTFYNATPSNRIVRLNPDGTPDSSFNSGAGANNTILVVVRQSDGKILIGGLFSSYNNTPSSRVARLNADGSLDTSFNSGTGANNAVASIALQSDGKILIGGTFTTYNGSSKNRIARLNADGSLDSSFNVGTVLDNSVAAIAVQSDSKIVIGGPFTGFIARLNTDGSLDSSFNVGSGPNNSVATLALQADGKILVGGNFTTFNGTSNNRIVRLNTDGSQDTTFNSGSGISGTVSVIAIQSDGKILVGGNFTNYNGTNINRIARLNTDGSLDANFNLGTGVNSTVSAITLQTNGKILIGGNFITYNGNSRLRLARLNTDGTLDTNFNSNAGANWHILAIALQTDGKILIGGNFTTYNGINRNGLARLNSNGTLDAVFNPGSGTNNTINAIALQPDGKIIIGGNFTTYNDTPINSLARLNADGSLDTSFNVGAGVTGNLYTIFLQNNGKILIGGDFTKYNNIATNSITRVNADGSLDTTFNLSTTTTGTVYAINRQSDGKILIGGLLTKYSGTPVNYFTRLNADGTLDTTLDANAGTNGVVNTIAVQSDDKIIIAGSFTSYNANAGSNIGRLNADGSFDANFNLNVGSGANDIIQTMAFQTDGKILIGGSFTSYKGTSSNRIARLNADGSLDTSFNIGTGASSIVSAIALQKDGKVVIGGFFIAVNNIFRDYIARLENPPTTTTSLTSSPNPAQLEQTITFTATVSPITATGTVRLDFGGSVNTAVTVTLNAGVATYVTTTLPLGQIPVTATYSSDATYLGSVSSIYTQTVNKIDSAISITSNPNPSKVGQAATFTATVTPARATGTVTFTIGAANITATLIGGVATYVTNTLEVGSYPVTATYSGDATFASSSSSSYTHLVTKIPTNLSFSSSPNPSLVGQTITFTANLTPTAATGTVTFTIGTANVGTALSSGVATYITNSLPVGNYVVTVSYGGDAIYTASTSSGQYTQIVCNPLVVTNFLDDGAASSCGTFSYTLAQATSGQTITFALTAGNTITFTGSLSPTVPTGVTIDGGANGVILEGNGVAGDGLRLSGNNTLRNLTIRRFAGREIVTLGTGNQFYRVRVES